MSAEFRIGYGWDSHEFKRGIPLMLGGVNIDHPKGLAGHSDGDVLLHAVCDALLGALALGDIGMHFPPSDERWKGAASSLFIEHAMRLLEERGWTVANVDATVIVQEPKLQPQNTRLRQSLAQLLKVPVDCASVKAKTPEGMGTEKAAIAHATVLLKQMPRARNGRRTAGKRRGAKVKI